MLIWVGQLTWLFLSYSTHCSFVYGGHHRSGCLVVLHSFIGTEFEGLWVLPHENGGIWCTKVFKKEYKNYKISNKLVIFIPFFDPLLLQNILLCTLWDDLLDIVDDEGSSLSESSLHPWRMSWSSWGIERTRQQCESQDLQSYFLPMLWVDNVLSVPLVSLNCSIIPICPSVIL